MPKAARVSGRLLVLRVVPFFQENNFSMEHPVKSAISVADFLFVFFLQYAKLQVLTTSVFFSLWDFISSSIQL